MSQFSGSHQASVVDHAFDGDEAVAWSAGMDGFQSLREALDAVDAALPIAPGLERRSRAGICGANAVDRQAN